MSEGRPGLGRGKSGSNGGRRRLEKEGSGERERVAGQGRGRGDRAVGGERDLRKAIGFPSKESFSF